jgi:hypothetical protein
MIRDNEIRDAASVAAWHLSSAAGCACRCASPPGSS